MNRTTYTTMMRAYTAAEWCDFAFFSANIQHVLGIQSVLQQEQLYRKYLDYSLQQAQLDMSHGEPANCTQWLQRSLQQDAMLVSFHYGQYRLIPLSLLSMGYRVCILVSRDVLQTQRAYYHACLRPEWFANLQFLVAEDPQLFFQLRRCSQAGYVLLCYVDGGAGVQSVAVTKSQGIMPVVLGQSLIQVRSGFAALAYLLHKPICLLLAPTVIAPNSAWTWDEVAVYHPSDHPDRMGYVYHVLHAVYTHLAVCLVQNPECWEAWISLQDTKPRARLPLEWADQHRYIPFEKQGSAFLLDKATYAIYPLEHKQFVQLKQSFVATC